MSIRAIGVAAAMVFAVACRTSGSQASGTSGTAQAPPPSPSETSGTAQSPSSPAGQDPLVESGPAIKAHASDEVVSGEIAEVTEESLSIASPVGGEATVLEIVPETSITVDGMEASAADLEEGLPVRAAYNQEEGRNVAVAIEVGQPSEPKELGTSAPSSSEPSSGTGSSASGSDMGGGSSGSSGAGSSSSGSAEDSSGKASPGNAVEPPSSGGSSPSSGPATTPNQ